MLSCPGPVLSFATFYMTGIFFPGFFFIFPPAFFLGPNPFLFFDCVDLLVIPRFLGHLLLAKAFSFLLRLIDFSSCPCWIFC